MKKGYAICILIIVMIGVCSCGLVEGAEKGQNLDVQDNKELQHNSGQAYQIKPEDIKDMWYLHRIGEVPIGKGIIEETGDIYPIDSKFYSEFCEMLNKIPIIEYNWDNFIAGIRPYDCYGIKIVMKDGIELKVTYSTFTNEAPLEIEYNNDIVDLEFDQQWGKEWGDLIIKCGFKDSLREVYDLDE